MPAPTSIPNRIAPARGSITTARRITGTIAIPTIKTTRNIWGSVIFTGPLSKIAENPEFVGGAPLQDVDRHEDDDPHDVYEVPVDARDLDAQVVLRLGAEVPPVGADVREGEQEEPDEY